MNKTMLHQKADMIVKEKNEKKLNHLKKKEFQLKE